jgi:hypothetical protein
MEVEATKKSSMEVELSAKKSLFDDNLLIKSLKNKRAALQDKFMDLGFETDELSKQTVFFLNASSHDYDELKKNILKRPKLLSTKTEQNYSALGLATIFPYKSFQEKNIYIQQLKDLTIETNRIEITREDKELEFIAWWEDLNWEKIPAEGRALLKNALQLDTLLEKNEKISLALEEIIVEILGQFVPKPLL